LVAPKNVSLKPNEGVAVGGVRVGMVGYITGPLPAKNRQSALRQLRSPPAGTDTPESEH
jgi:hypothetical protein